MKMKMMMWSRSRSLGALALSCMVVTAGCYDPGAVHGRRSWLQLAPSRVASVIVGSAWAAPAAAIVDAPQRLPAAEAEASVRALVDRSIQEKPERAGGYLRLAFHDAIASDTARGML